jgi:hypothetical protein
MYRLLYFLAALTIALTILISYSHKRETRPDYQAYSEQNVIKDLDRAE